MKRKYLITSVILILLIVLSFQGWKKSEASDSPAPVPKKIVTTPPYYNPKLEEFLAAYESEIEALMKSSGVPGAAIAVVKDSNIVFLKGFGVKMAYGSDSIDSHTVFRLASVSKCFASFLTGILVSDSVVSWDDPVIKYVPSFALKSDEQTHLLTLRHVLSHTTGLPYHTYTNLVEEGIALPDLLAKLKDVQLSNGVGKEYSYQNVAYSVIGEVLGSATHSRYDSLMRKFVFSPLHMMNASMSFDEITHNTNVARPHLLRRGRWIPTSIKDTYYNVAPAGGINASIADMAQWMIALLGEKETVITQETLDQLFVPEVKAPSKNRNYSRTQRLSSSYYGLGWRVLHYPTDTLIYHGGYVSGYRSEVAINPKYKIAVCLLANAPGAVADKGIPTFFNLFRAQRDSIVAYDDRQRKARLTKSELP